VRIRAAEVGDAEAVFGMLTRFAMSYTPERAAFDRSFPALIGEKRALLHVAVEGGELVGYVMAAAFDALFANGPVVQIEELFVEGAERGRGIGGELVEAATEWARSIGAREVTVPTRRAGPYYERLGFEETAAYFHKRL
jgi:predicted N-acetyltransferase YhbS